MVRWASSPWGPPKVSVSLRGNGEERSVGGQGGGVRPGRGPDRLGPALPVPEAAGRRGGGGGVPGHRLHPGVERRAGPGPAVRRGGRRAGRAPSRARRRHRRLPRALAGDAGRRHPGRRRAAGRAARDRPAAVRPDQLVGRDLRARPRALRSSWTGSTACSSPARSGSSSPTRPSSSCCWTGSASTPVRPSTSTTRRPTWPPPPPSASTRSGSPVPGSCDGTWQLRRLLARPAPTARPSP